MGGWGRDAVLVAPNGDVLPCQAASTIPGMEFDNVRDKPLGEIWFESEAFNRFRGTEEVELMVEDVRAGGSPFKD